MVSQQSHENVKITFAKTNSTRTIAKLRSQMLDNVSQLAKRYRAADDEEREEIVKERRAMEVEIVEQVIAATN